MNDVSPARKNIHVTKSAVVLCLLLLFLVGGYAFLVKSPAWLSTIIKKETTQNMESSQSTQSVFSGQNVKKSTSCDRYDTAAKNIDIGTFDSIDLNQRMVKIAVPGKEPLYAIVYETTTVLFVKDNCKLGSFADLKSLEQGHNIGIIKPSIASVKRNFEFNGSSITKRVLRLESYNIIYVY